MIYNVFDTEAEAINAEKYDFIKFMEVLSDQNGYDSSTFCWAIPSQRITDKKWVYRVCPYSDVIYNTEESKDEWFIE
jgi:hypothetical protein